MNAGRRLTGWRSRTGFDTGALGQDDAGEGWAAKDGADVRQRGVRTERRIATEVTTMPVERSITQSGKMAQRLTIYCKNSLQARCGGKTSRRGTESFAHPEIEMPTGRSRPSIRLI